VLTRLDPRRAPTVLLVLAPLGLLVLIVWLVAEPARMGFAGDLVIYHEYGRRLLQGSIPYLDFKVEYPPLALAPMTLPLLVAPPGGLTEVDYLWRFTLMEGVLAAAGGWLIFRATDHSRTALVWWAVLVSVAWASVALRYDLWAVLCVLVAVLVVDRRPGTAGVAVGLGAMLKLYPIALLPVLCAWAIARRDGPGLARLLAGCASVVVVVMAAAWALAGPESLQWLLYQADRGLQIESLGSGLLMGLHVLFGQPVDVTRGFGTIQVESSGSDLLVAASPIALALLLGLVVLVALRRFRLDEDRLGRVPRPPIVLASVAAIAAVLVGSKVLSVQYVIWLLPFVPFLPVGMRWLVLAIAALSTAIYTVDYQALMHLEAPWILALVVRNGLLAALLAWLVAELWGSRGSSAVHDQAPAGAGS
jgi:Glycosyltransferase family 87